MNVLLSDSKKATQWIFLICGTGLSSWAPVVPFVKDRLMITESSLGLLLLMLGLGAIVMMPISGYLMSLFGSRKIMAISVVLVAVTLPALLIVPSYSGMMVFLFIFGCGIGTVDVAMNAHGVQVQNLYGRPIMSSLHGLFSVGGIIGSVGLGFLLKLGLDPMYSAIVISSLLIGILSYQYRYLFSRDFENKIAEKLSSSEESNTKKGRFLWLNKSVILIGFLCFSVFLSEGAMLDWSALFLKNAKGISAEFAGVGYACFSVAMAIMRLTGDRIVEKFNENMIVIGGCLLSIIGLVVAIFASSIFIVLLGFVLLGVGASNIVPILFSEGGRIKGIPATVSISAITTMGYAGQLAGPALLGFIADHYSLALAFGTISFLMFIVLMIYILRKQY